MGDNTLRILCLAMACLWTSMWLPLAAQEDEGPVDVAQETQATLQNTIWRIDVLDGETLPVGTSDASPQLVVQAGARRTFRATLGCNQFRGGYGLEHGKIVRFRPGASTRAACPAPLDRLEVQFLQALSEIESYEIDGDTLALKDAAGEVRLRLTAVRF